jgi:predicted ribosomally synthesized peptide with nif11-like leader
MSIESAKAFIERIKTDEDFAQKYIARKDAEKLMVFVKAEGFDCTPEELNEVLLEGVSGGVPTISFPYLGASQSQSILFANMVNQQAQLATIAAATLTEELAQLFGSGC